MLTEYESPLVNELCGRARVCSSAVAGNSSGEWCLVACHYQSASASVILVLQDENVVLFWSLWLVKC